MFGHLKGRHRDHHKIWGRGRDHHHRGGRRRAFEQGDLRIVILKLIAEEPRHGYDIIKAIEATFGGTYSPSPGVVYPTLTLLDDQGFATVAQEGTKKLYTVTPEGRAFLEANKATVDALYERMSTAQRTFGGGLAPEIRRALENFRAAFELRLGSENVSKETIANIAKAIDDAAAAVERA
ncbi:MAG: PadR family transcriptional regulator [Parvibaculum sp.]|nr:PadR family transcriptional regulator [Parvibaculum sp.]